MYTAPRKRSPDNLRESGAGIAEPKLLIFRDSLPTATTAPFGRPEARRVGRGELGRVVACVCPKYVVSETSIISSSLQGDPKFIDILPPPLTPDWIGQS